MKFVEPNQIKTILVVIAVIFFYIGDIITTGMILGSGGVELNRFLAGIGFTGYLIFKTIVTLILCGIIYYTNKIRFYTVSGTIIGIMLMTGILATVFNLGAFGN